MDLSTAELTQSGLPKRRDETAHVRADCPVHNAMDQNETIRRVTGAESSPMSFMPDLNLNWVSRRCLTTTNQRLEVQKDRLQALRSVSCYV